jgi:hypothetical protein
MDTREIVATYFAAWNEPDPAKRTALLEASLAEDGVYRDPLASAHCRAALVAHIDGFHARRPGHTIEQASGVDITDAGLRWAWVMRDGDEMCLRGSTSRSLLPTVASSESLGSSGRSLRSTTKQSRAIQSSTRVGQCACGNVPDGSG